MDRIRLVNVPVRVNATVSPEHYAAVRQEASARLDIRAMFDEAVRHPGDTAWVEQQAAEVQQTMQAIEWRAKLEAGRIVLKAQAGLAVVGQPLRTFLVTLADGKVISINGGGSAE